MKQMDGTELWIAFGVGKGFRYLSAHSVSHALGKEKSRSLPMFHAFTGCDQTSFFTGKGKKTAWSTWELFDYVTEAFTLSFECTNLEYTRLCHANTGTFCCLDV